MNKKVNTNTVKLFHDVNMDEPKQHLRAYLSNCNCNLKLRAIGHAPIFQAMLQWSRKMSEIFTANSNRSVLGQNTHISTIWMVLFAFFLLLLRAWPRLLHPEVWDEDGTQNLAGFLTNGVADLLRPVSGYLLVIPKLITMLSASISFAFYPLISTIFAWAFTIFVLVIIAKAPVRLKGGFLLAFLSIAIPSDPENFGLPLYTFWWSALLLFILIFWDENSPNFWLRSLILALASLSSPVCLVTLPLFIARAVFLRERPTEVRLALMASLFAGIQLWVMWPIAKGGGLDLRTLPDVIPVFLGNYTVGNIFPNKAWLLGSITLGYVLIGLARNKSSWVLWALSYLWVASVLMSITRVDINFIHPVLAGPRYFFFPFIVLSWILLQLTLGDKSMLIRVLGGCLLTLSLANAMPNLTRHHDELNWLGHFSSCSQFPEYKMPVHYAGSASNAWGFTLAGSQCEELLRKDFLAGFVTKKTYPYQVVGKTAGTNPEAIDTPELSRINNRGWLGTDYYSWFSGNSSLPDIYEIFGSYAPSKSDTGAITVHMRKGEKILFRTDSKSGQQRILIAGHDDIFFDTAPTAPEWIILDFSSRLLPDEFDVQFVDGGNGPGEWSAIALKKAISQ